MDLVARVQAIILKPKEEWVKIKAETTTVKDLFMSYALILAAIPAVAQFIGNALIGRRLPFYGWYRWNIGTALIYAVFMYIAALATVYILGLIIDALAPNFASQKNQLSAMKLAVFSMTPGWVAGALYIVPFLGILAALGSLYGLYVLYLGFSTPLMETPKDKVVGYFVVSLVVAIVLTAVFGLILGAFFAVGGAFRTL
ncbi:MAG: Yip1 family protein [Acidobacteriota bacterium]|nr:Yip1 family protein [Acidobacteriota bacterium]